ncbi:hypothetical protein H7F15_10745 [Pontibacter sp. Tf4]|uniref:hypothetical protein n=1 Tax=Pontibacter sp. Tf4 TaxID=2761620 RepID=UPI001624C64D|nr:hypothetical protein [Pontibacter sp. Tf4]MBB6611515.1 hypothetical protein [Pontibacter sp. Tf4]
MKKITTRLLTIGILATGLLAACSSETTTGVDAGDTNTENNQTDMGTGTDTAATDTYPDTTYQNPPTDDNAGNQDQQ